MRYLLMICTDETWLGALSPEESAAMSAEYGKFNEEIGGRGQLQGGERLHPTTTATSVQVRDGDVIVSDGPFAETKEQMGGYYLVDCKDADEAIEIAAKIPGARYGTIEVRPIWEFQM
ncbi:MAG: YciI family protein [Actinomycetia bacterium]|nr:YciI family protein [Actinomycetes bacterium]